MEIDKWVSGYKVRSFPWIDGKRIYLNVQYYLPGQSLSQPPAFDKSVYIADNEAGQNLIQNHLDSLVEFVARMTIKDGYKVVITAGGQA